MQVRFFSLLKEIDEGVIARKDVSKLTDERDYIQDEIFTMEMVLAIEVANFNLLNQDHMQTLVSNYEQFCNSQIE